uniref:Uncharacterized protein n=1 Tax=Panagrolaimus sp. PS1159 TaxID=55785 RepID=A0AC35FGI4_9BILA
MNLLKTVFVFVSYYLLFIFPAFGFAHDILISGSITKRMVKNDKHIIELYQKITDPRKFELKLLSKTYNVTINLPVDNDFAPKFFCYDLKVIVYIESGNVIYKCESELYIDEIPLQCDKHEGETECEFLKIPTLFSSEKHKHSLSTAATMAPTLKTLMQKDITTAATPLRETVSKIPPTAMHDSKCPQTSDFSTPTFVIIIVLLIIVILNWIICCSVKAVVDDLKNNAKIFKKEAEKITNKESLKPPLLAAGKGNLGNKYLPDSVLQRTSSI